MAVPHETLGTPMSRWSLALEPAELIPSDRVADGTAEPLAALRSGITRGSLQVVYLATDAVPAAELLGELPPDERARAARLVDPAMARRFVAGRWLLCSVLAAVVGGEPADIRFSFGAHGKPALAGADAPSFNLSHTGELAAVALLARGPVGIDIELVRPIARAAQLAQRIFTAGEALRHRALPERLRLEALFAAWVRKEAVLKALGTGVSGFLESVEVPLDPAARQETAVTAGVVPGRKASRWALRPLPMAPGFQGALAVESPGHSLRVWRARPVRRDR